MNQGETFCQWLKAHYSWPGRREFGFGLQGIGIGIIFAEIAFPPERGSSPIIFVAILCIFYGGKLLRPLDR
jgi:hypothetical protein